MDKKSGALLKENVSHRILIHFQEISARGNVDAASASELTFSAL